MRQSHQLYMFLLTHTCAVFASFLKTNRWLASNTGAKRSDPLQAPQKPFTAPLPADLPSLLAAWFISDKLFCLPAYKLSHPTLYCLLIHLSRSLPLCTNRTICSSHQSEQWTSTKTHELAFSTKGWLQWLSTFKVFLSPSIYILGWKSELSQTAS
jgi:hypothetical protein